MEGGSFLTAVVCIKNRLSKGIQNSKENGEARITCRNMRETWLIFQSIVLGLHNVFLRLADLQEVLGHTISSVFFQSPSPSMSEGRSPQSGANQAILI